MSADLLVHYRMHIDHHVHIPDGTSGTEVPGLRRNGTDRGRFESHRVHHKMAQGDLNFKKMTADLQVYHRMHISSIKLRVEPQEQRRSEEEPLHHPCRSAL